MRLSPLVTIHTWSLEALGNTIYNANALTLNTLTSTAYPAANRAIFIPFYVYKPITVRKLWAFNGATASGNIDVGIYDSAGNRLVSSGSTAQAGTSAIQEFDVTDTVLQPGLYYLAVAKDDTTGTLQRGAAGSVQQLQMMGVAIQGSAFPLPTTATFATASGGNTYLPFIGLTTRVVI